MKMSEGYICPNCNKSLTWNDCKCWTKELEQKLAEAEEKYSAREKKINIMLRQTEAKTVSQILELQMKLAVCNEALTHIYETSDDIDSGKAAKEALNQLSE
jgi:uncharacterized Zn finger protein (UPF0148 family)